MAGPHCPHCQRFQINDFFLSFHRRDVVFLATVGMLFEYCVTFTPVASK